MRLNLRWLTMTALALLTALTAAARGQTTQATQPAAGALTALDRDVQTLYRSVQASVVRVTIPVRIPTKLLEQEHPLSKWRPQLDPKLREQLEQRDGDSGRIYIDPRPTTETGPQQAGSESSQIPITPPTAVINMEFIGLILNSQGDVLLPLYIDSSLLDTRLKVIFGERQATTAKVVGADRQTRLTVVRLAEPLGQPVRLSLNRLALGSLMLFMSPTRRQARLGVWTGGQDENAILINLAGNIAGLVRSGHVMLPSAFGPVVEQLLASGTVQRAKLGVMIKEVAADDPLRGSSGLGNRPAARVEEVLANSAAAAAGLQVGDLIIALGGEPVEDMANFAAAISNRRGRTELQILRQGIEQNAIVDLQPQ